MNATTLITGASGFLGRHLVRALLAEGRPVRLLLRRGGPDSDDIGRTFRSEGAEVVFGDLLDPPSLRAAVDSIDAVVHLAGRLLIPGVPAKLYTALHVDGTRHLLEACASAGRHPVVTHVSTTGVLGPTGRAPAVEDAPQRPSNPYEQSKAAGEALALELAAHLGLRIVVARPSLVYGPGDLHLLGWFRAIARGWYRVVGSGDHLVHPIFVDDAIAGIRRCGEAAHARGRVYHVVGDAPVPIRTLAAAIATTLGRVVQGPRIPVSVARAGAVLFECVPGLPPSRLPLSRQRVRFMTEDRAYSGARARTELGFAPSVDLASGLRATVDWYRGQGLL